ncbi:aldo/keto reductase [Vulgatibacter incomptus]|uniref:Putative aldo/keto reductase n=1 Tax=Vulgatibacter incomptus TaxID=1391653 RepID=A0A0K1PHW7_9BACT|nr:aldo/keto reductase [Vulgatibacter incomptus]AKU93133.1 putative aldo/keto reductase [Vulgatibacter incomptus]
MERRKLPGTDREVSAIGLGTWVAGGAMWGGSDARLIGKTIEKALELGIDLIDTAPVYGFGRSEEIVGAWLDEAKVRDRVFLATKCGLAWDEAGRIRRDSSPARIRSDVEASLSRLRTERLDLVQIHWPDPATPIAASIEALETLREEGKLLWYGVSNYSAAQLAEATAAGRPVVNQVPYNLFEREIEEDVLPTCRELDVGVFAYGAICRGLLSGKFRPETTFPEGDIRSSDPKFQPPRFARYLAAVDRLRPMAYARNKSLTHLAVRWLLDQPGVTAALWGARSPSQIEQAAGATGWRLAPGELEGIDRIVREEVQAPIGPEFMAPPV